MTKKIDWSNKLDISKNDCLIHFGSDFEVDRFIEYEKFRGRDVNRMEYEYSLLNNPEFEIQKTQAIIERLFELHSYLALSNKHICPSIQIRGKYLRKEYIRPTGHYYWSEHFKIALTNAIKSISKKPSFKLKELDLVGDYYVDFSPPKSSNVNWLNSLQFLPKLRINLIDHRFNSNELEIIKEQNSNARKYGHFICVYDVTKNNHQAAIQKELESYNKEGDDGC